MKNISHYQYLELHKTDLAQFQGGGPIKEAAKWYYMTVGSFYRGIYDGLVGNSPAI